MPRRRLLVFLKAPRRGTVKTRLAAALGDDGALAAYRELVTMTLARLDTLPAATEVELRFTPDDAAAELGPWLRQGWGCAPQGDGDLGARLARAFADAFADGCERVAVIGTDCPYLQADDLLAAWDALERSDVVLGPATDGGYWLLALRAPRPELFADIAWSTSAVLEQTTAKACAAGLSAHRLRELSDVDTEADWRRFNQWRRKEPAV